MLEDLDKKLAGVGFFRCPLCRTELMVKKDKKGYPYLTCFSCWMQIFVRGRNGVERLKRRVKVYG